jgi:hypothetical protein
MHRFLSWRYAEFKTTWNFDAAVITHPDADHYEGFRPLFEHPNVRFKSVFHNGIMEERSKRQPLGPMATFDGRRYLTHLIATRDDLDAFLAQTERWMHPTQPGSHKRYPSLLRQAHESGRCDDIRMLAATGAGPAFMPGYGPDRELSVEVLGPVPQRPQGDQVLRCFGPKPSSTAFDDGKTKNGHSVILKLRYRDITVLFGGDLNMTAEAFLLEQHTGVTAPWPWSRQDEERIIAAGKPIFGADVIKSCHHGSADFTDAFLDTVLPLATIVSSGDEESHAHPRSDTLGAIGRHSRGLRPLIFSTELSRSTRERENAELHTAVGRIAEMLATATTDEARATLAALYGSVTEELLKRNVTTYGAINLRTDGRKAVVAYMLEQARVSKNGLTKWDIYPLERRGNGPLEFQPLN